MIQKFFGLFLMLLVCYLEYGNCEGDYTVVGSRIIRPSYPYLVTINLHNYTEPATFTVGIRSDDYENLRNVTVQPSESQVIRFETDDIPNDTTGGRFRLYAEEILEKYDKKLDVEYQRGYQISRNADLNINRKSFSVFVQTDKAMYKPGDNVKFRVLILDSETKPAIIKGPLKVYIKDGKSNRIKQWLDAETTKGVYTNEFQLSDSPVLGTWQIVVDVMNKTQEKVFEVAEYVLPKFEVTIDTNKHLTYKDGKISIVVRSKYTYGKSVKGEATISVRSSGGGFRAPGSYPSRNIGVSDGSYNLQKVLPIDGKVFVEFDFEKDLGVNDKYDYDSEIYVDVKVKETLTGRILSASSSVSVHKSKYNIKVVKSPSIFKAGLPFDILFQVHYHDGSPVKDAEQTLNLLYGPGYDRRNYTEAALTLDSNGMALFKLPTSFQNTSLVIRAQYLDIEVELANFEKALTKNDIYLQATLLTEKPILDDSVKVNIVCTEEMEYFDYIILGRGQVIKSERIEVPSESTYTLKFLPTITMIPKAYLIIYYVKDGEIISDNLEISFDDEFKNFVKIELSDQQAKTGQSIGLTVSTDKNSYVGLLGIDQSVALLKSGNDLSKSEIFADLNNYASRYYSNRRKRFTTTVVQPSRNYPGYYSTPDYYKDFDNAGTVMLTSIRKYVYYDGMAQPQAIAAFGGGGGHQFASANRQPIEESAGINPSFLNKLVSESLTETVTVRKDFRETWIWNEFDAPDGIITLNKTVPDTITSWLITGFSTNSESGLGLTKAPRKLTVFKPFFISLNLPYSVKRGEILSLEANVFNYMDEDVTADVTLYNEENEFEFTEITNEVLDTPKAQETQQKQTIKIEANSGATVTFLIKPIKVGGMIIKMMATTAMAGDAIQQILPVKADGLPQYNTKSDFIVLCEKKEDESTLAFEVPDDIVPDSTVVEVSVVGDILGQTIKHLDQLIRLPAGCGEQNMLNFVPNVVILNYLKHTNQTTPKVEAKAKRYLESGYQQELAFQRYDGSFSAFGRNDVSGSIWLTAFVAKSFRQASVYIDIDDVIIENALKWLSENQASNGSFPEVGKVIHGEMQSSANGGMALTAYVLTAFLENQGPIPSYQYVITKALEYIDENIPLIEDTYTLSIVAYALQLAEHTSKDSVFTSLDKQAKIVGDKKWWHKPLPKAEKISRWYSIQPNSVNVEMSAYGLLTFLEAKQFADALPIVKWLLEQRNSYGGFQSTQDTVVGLQALGKFAELIWTDKMNLKASINYEDTKQEITVNNENAALLQTYRLPSTVRSVNVKASGEGIALLQLSYKYNLQTPEGWQQFTLKPIVKKQVNPNFIQLSVCTSFVPIEGATLSNMAIMEITFPSGYVADRDTISALEGTKSIQKVELKNGDTLVIVYFDALSSQRVCPVFYAYRTYKIADQKPASVAIYDYYENSRRAEAFYEIEKATICDICEGPECKKACAVEKVEATTENETELKCTFFLCKKLCNKKIKV